MAGGYDDILTIDTFNGINQSNSNNIKMSYAIGGKNFFTANGVLQSVPKSKIIYATAGHHDYSGEILNTSVSGKTDYTLAFMTQRWKQGVSGAIEADTVWMIAVACNRLFCRKWVKGTQSEPFYESGWTELTNPETGNSFAFAQNRFDYTPYELNYAPAVTLTSSIISEVYAGTKQYYCFDTDDYSYHVVKSDNGTLAYYENVAGESVQLVSGTSKVRMSYIAPVDCLLITNANDGMYCVYAPLDSPSLAVVPVKVQPSGANETRFGCIALFAERIFGAGIQGDPDKMMYSAPNDPFNWEQNNLRPEDGAGDIQEPEWNGDGFTALHTFGNALIAIKKHSIWRIVGTNPSVFYVTKEYGEGTIVETSVSILGAYMYFLSSEGLMYYDGSASRYLKYGTVKDIVGSMLENTDKVCSCICGANYCVAFGTNLLIYNTVEQTFNFIDTYDNPNQDDGMYALSSFNSRLYYLSFLDLISICLKTQPITNADTGNSSDARGMDWVSAWQDLGAKNISKGEFEIYLCTDVSMTITVGLRTERKLKEKTVELIAGKPKRVRMNNNGRRYQLTLHTVASGLTPPGQSAPLVPGAWKLNGGIQIYVSYDYD